ncbi:hypothetical protein D9611_006270 [Ephemerocybe angulata]|uniref:Cytochrome P450 n=1 Tax=Ephemerocybe angulata TaxID=980116 RepID=A0A8H5FG76_9AGAR|nr:hypothetical protein D9611_006270 [Tulosesus angulatus]
MVPIFYGVIHKLRKSIVQLVGPGESEIDILSWMSRVSLEIIGQSGFGYSFDTLGPHAIEHPYATSVRHYFPAIHDTLLTAVRLFIFPYVHNLGSPRFQRAVVDAFPSRRLHHLRDLVDTMHNTSVEIFESAKQAMNDDQELLKRIGGGKDLMSVLLRENMKASVEDRLSDEELLAQISTFIFAGMDTTANALTRTLHVLSEHPDTQERLRKEVCDAYANYANLSGDLDYDTLGSKMPLLDAICRETLRLVKQNGILPLSKPVTTTDGQRLDEIFVPKGTKIFISIHNSNRDPTLWGPDASDWKPERWLRPLPETVTSAHIPGIYANQLTFLAGHRACIGFKFSQLEMKAVLADLIQNFRFAPTGKNVVWLSNGVRQPTIEGAGLTATGQRKLCLPLKVSLVQPA